MTSGPDCYSTFLRFGVLESEYNVVFILRLDDQARVHVMIDFVSRQCILVLLILIISSSMWKLFACDASDSSHFSSKSRERSVSV